MMDVVILRLPLQNESPNTANNLRPLLQSREEAAFRKCILMYCLAEAAIFRGKSGRSGGTRTPNQRLKRPLLYH